MKLQRLNGVVIIDTREQRPLDFENLRFGKYATPWEIPTVRSTLQQGDYSLVGHEDRIAIERKSAADITQSLTHHRDRFLAELERLRNYDFSAVLIETTWSDLLEYAWTTTSVDPSSLDSSILACMMRYPTQWVFRPSRYDAAKTVAKIFRLFLKELANEATPRKKSPAGRRRRNGTARHSDRRTSVGIAGDRG